MFGCLACGDFGELGLGVVFVADLVVDFVIDLFDLADAGLFFAATGLTGVLNSLSPPNVKLISLIGETEDVFPADLRDADLVADLVAERLLVLVADFLRIDDGVVLSLDDALGRGVLLIGLVADFLAGVALVRAAIFARLYVNIEQIGNLETVTAFGKVELLLCGTQT